MPVFGYDKACRALKSLGFVIDKTRGKGDHDLAFHPSKKPNPQRQRPFITVPHWKEYASRNFRAAFIREIIAFGFTRDEVIKVFS